MFDQYFCFGAIASPSVTFVNAKDLDPMEEHLSDSVFGVFETRLLVGYVKELKKFILSNPSVLPTKLRSGICKFFVESLFHFLDFIKWSVENYWSSERVIMDS